MTIKYVYTKINQAMESLSGIDFLDISSDKRRYNQKKVHEAYDILDGLNDEVIREIKINKIKKERKK